MTEAVPTFHFDPARSACAPITEAEIRAAVDAILDRDAADERSAVMIIVRFLDPMPAFVRRMIRIGRDPYVRRALREARNEVAARLPDLAAIGREFAVDLRQGDHQAMLEGWTSMCTLAAAGRLVAASMDERPSRRLEEDARDLASGRSIDDYVAKLRRGLRERAAHGLMTRAAEDMDREDHQVIIARLRAAHDELEDGPAREAISEILKGRTGLVGIEAGRGGKR